MRALFAFKGKAFYIAMQYPSSMSPSNGVSRTAINDGAFYLSWNDPTSYPSGYSQTSSYLQVSTSSNFSSLLVDQTISGSTNQFYFNPSSYGISNGQDIYWRVKNVSGSFSSEWSNIYYVSFDAVWVSGYSYQTTVNTSISVQNGGSATAGATGTASVTGTPGNHEGSLNLSAACSAGDSLFFGALDSYFQPGIGILRSWGLSVNGTVRSSTYLLESGSAPWSTVLSYPITQTVNVPGYWIN